MKKRTTRLLVRKSDISTGPIRYAQTLFRTIRILSQVASDASFGSPGGPSVALDSSTKSISIPMPEKRLSDLTEPVRDGIHAPLPLHRTESRLPSLERIFRDDKLRSSLYEDSASDMLNEIASVILMKDDRDLFKGLQELCRRSGQGDNTFNINRTTSKQREAIIDAVVLFVKQQLAKIVDYWHTIIDQRELGIQPEDFEAQVAHAPFEYSIKPWSFVSLGLKLLRNFCDSKEVQNLLYFHNLADTLVLRHRLLFAAVSTASAVSDPPGNAKPHYDEVANVLPRSLFTFLSNLITNNDKLRCHFWGPMWPLVYWTYLTMAGDKFFDWFCLLLHNHMTPLIADLPADDPADEERVQSPAVRNLEADLRLLVTSEEELAIKLQKLPSDSPSHVRVKLESDFLPFLMAILAVIHMKNERVVRGGQFRRTRLASVEGRAAEASAVETEWFGLLLLRLISLGRGHALKLLLTSMLEKSKTTPEAPHVTATPGVSADTERRAMKAAMMGVPNGVLYFLKSAPDCQRYLPDEYPSPVQLAGLLIYTAARNAAADDEAALIQRHLQDTETTKREHEVMEERSAAKLGRKFNLIRRGFITPNVTLFMADLLKESLADLATETRQVVGAPGVFDRVVSLLNESGFDEFRRKGKDMARLSRPLTRCLRHFAAAPELRGRWDESVACVLWKLAAALLKDVSPFFQEFVASGAAKKPDNPECPMDAYSLVLQNVSPRDVLLLMATLADMSPSLRDDCDRDLFSALLGFTTFQTEDENCEQASILALRVLTKGHEVNSKLVDDAKPPRSTFHGKLDE